MTVDPQHRDSNEAKKANRNGYDRLRFEKPFDFHGLYKHIPAL